MGGVSYALCSPTHNDVMRIAIMQNQSKEEFDAMKKSADDRRVIKIVGIVCDVAKAICRTLFYVLEMLLYV